MICLICMPETLGLQTYISEKSQALMLQVTPALQKSAQTL